MFKRVIFVAAIAVVLAASSSIFTSSVEARLWGRPAVVYAAPPVVVAPAPVYRTYYAPRAAVYYPRPILRPRTAVVIGY